jgi:hypothetical protein
MLTHVKSGKDLYLLPPSQDQRLDAWTCLKPVNSRDLNAILVMRSGCASPMRHMPNVYPDVVVYIIAVNL